MTLHAIRSNLEMLQYLPWTFGKYVVVIMLLFCVLGAVVQGFMVTGKTRRL